MLYYSGGGGGLSEAQISNSNPFDYGDNKCLWLKSTMVAKSVETKFDFRASWTHSPTPSPQTMLIFLFFGLQRPNRPHNIELGGGGSGTRDQH